jgi:putative redox protein
MPDANIISTVVAENNSPAYTTNLQAGNHRAIADEPVIIGGQDIGPAPGDYLCMALASCKAITLRMYIQRKKWDIQNITVKVSLERLDGVGITSHTFYAQIIVDDSVPQEQKERLIQIAKACPISKLLSKQNEIVTTLAQR